MCEYEVSSVCAILLENVRLQIRCVLIHEIRKPDNEIFDPSSPTIPVLRFRLFFQSDVHVITFLRLAKFDRETNVSWRKVYFS